MNHYIKLMHFEKSAHQVFEALTNEIPKWWTELFEGSANQEGKSFTIRFGDKIFKTMMVEELLSYQKVIWKVTDSLIDLPELKNKTEWIGTHILWEINTKDNETELNLAHIGLTPEVECYDVCQGGWEQFTHSFVKYINTGVGYPFKKA